MFCNLQIFSGCVCHLEQPHAQPPFLFLIVFGINLISFFNIGSVVLCVLLSGMLSFTWATAQSHMSLLVALSLRAATSNLSLLPKPLSNESVIHNGRKHKTVVFLQLNAVHNRARTPYKFAAFAIGCLRRPCSELRT